MGCSWIRLGEAEKLVAARRRDDSGGFKKSDEFLPRQVIVGCARVGWGVGKIDGESATQKDDNFGGRRHFSSLRSETKRFWPWKMNNRLTVERRLYDNASIFCELGAVN